MPSTRWYVCEWIGGIARYLVDLAASDDASRWGSDPAAAVRFQDHDAALAAALLIAAEGQVVAVVPLSAAEDAT